MSNGKTPTGIPGLDEMLSGGFPKGRVILVMGGPGTGKTVLSTQFIINGIEKFNENGVFVSLDESKTHFYSEMSKFGWNLAKYESEKKFAFVDASPIRHLPGEVKIGKLTIGRRDFSMLSLIEAVKNGAQNVKAQRIVVDPIASLVFQFPDPVERRTAILDLIEALTSLEATTILTTELRAYGLERGVQLEEYLAHGVIVMQNLRAGRAYVRALQIEKMREAEIDMQPRPYRITNSGIEVFPEETVF
ncbi:MAG: ATPase domain-containing protein [Candidatus Bathyarchaeia archaeon]